MPEEVFQEDAQALRKELATALERVSQLEIALTLLASDDSAIREIKTPAPVRGASTPWALEWFREEREARKAIAAKALKGDEIV